MQRGELWPLYSGKQTAPSTVAWHNTGEASHRDRTQFNIWILRRKVTALRTPNFHVLDREDRWFERGVKEPIYVHSEKPSLKWGGGLRCHYNAYNAVFGVLPKRFNLHSHLGPCDPKMSHETGVKGKHCRVIYIWAHVTLTTYMMPSCLPG